MKISWNYSIDKNTVKTDYGNINISKHFLQKVYSQDMFKINIFKNIWPDWLESENIIWAFTISNTRNSSSLEYKWEGTSTGKTYGGFKNILNKDIIKFIFSI